MGDGAIPSCEHVYRPRRPRESPLHRVLHEHYQEFRRVYDERFARTHGRFRAVIDDAVERFLTCGDLHEGFARVRCSHCRHEFLVAFSCRRRCLCPSCHQKRCLILAQHVAGEVCEPVAHRQFVFTIPKRLRIFFRLDRKLLGHLPRLAWRSVLEVTRSVLGRPDVTPGMIGTIHTFGQLLHFHPHLHAIVSDGAFTPEGVFLPLPEVDGEPYEKIWRRLVFELLLDHGRIEPAVVEQMRGWRHSGFSVHREIRVPAGDTAGLERLASYLLRCPLSLARLIRITDRGEIVYRASHHAPQRFAHPAQRRLFKDLSRNFQLFDPLEFIAEVTQHVPDPRKHLIRYFGFYSNKSRGCRAKAEAATQGREGDSAGPSDAAPQLSPFVVRRRWAALIQRVYEVDPLRCPRCGRAMTIVGFIRPTQPDVIERILRRLGLWEPIARAPPDPGQPQVSAAREPRYELDPDVVQALPRVCDEIPNEPDFDLDREYNLDREDASDGLEHS